MQARYYDPVIGRFYSNDPIGFRDVHSFNRYAYANNNPYKYKDPDGNNPKLIFDFAANVTINYLTTGSLGLGSAALDTLEGALDPTRSIRKAEKIYKLLKKYNRTGSYTITFKNGKQYHGKGGLKRMEKSAKDKAEKNGGIEGADWSEASSHRQAFKDEANRIANSGGIGPKTNNLNKINSPGKKYNSQDKMTRAQAKQRENNLGN